MSDRLFHLLSDLPMLLLVGGGLIVVVMRRARLSGSAVPAFAGLGAWAAAVALSQAWTQVLRSSLSRADAAAMAAWVDGTILALYGAGLLLLVIGMSAGRPPDRRGAGEPGGWPGPAFPQPGPPAFAPPGPAPAPPPWGQAPSGRTPPGQTPPVQLPPVQLPPGQPPADPAPWTQQPPGPASWGPVPPGPMPPPGPAQPSEWARPPSERPHS